MKRLYWNRILSAAAVVFWMAGIFLFSAQTGTDSGNLSGGIVNMLLHFFFPGFDKLPLEEQLRWLDICRLLVRKGAHMAEYAVLAMLCANALRTYPLSRLLQWIAPVGICLLYAISDEIHQSFVPGRACSPWDVCIDTAGAICGVIAFMTVAALIRTQKSKKQDGIQLN